MAVHLPGVSERVFEFAFNSQFCNSSGSLVVGCPYIPTQNQEKRLGYDVAMKIASGSQIRSLYLQHKVARFVDGRSGSNMKFRVKVGSPYYAYSLDVDQYNLIHRFSQKKTRDFYYCSPIFTTRKALSDHYATGSVVANSAWIDVSNCDAIASADIDPHCMVYDSNLSQAYRFSDEPDEGARIQKPTLEAFYGTNNDAQKFETADLVRTYAIFFNTLKDWWPERRLHRRKTEIEDGFRMRARLPAERHDFKQPADVVDAIRQITSEYLGVTWLMKVVS